MKLFEGYLGAKAALRASIIGRMPWHSVYVEAFLGAGWVMRHKRPALQSIGIDSNPEVVKRWRESMPGVTVIEGDGVAWLERHGVRLPTDALVFADPPYVHLTRTARRRWNYGAHELTDDRHAQLLAALEALGCSVFLTGYPHPLYDDRLTAAAGWQREAFDVMTRGGPRVEVLWSKLSPSALLGASASEYPGRNFRDRLRLRRLCERWERRFESMPDIDRAAVFERLARVLVASSADSNAAGLAAADTGAVRRRRRLASAPPMIAQRVAAEHCCADCGQRGERTGHHDCQYPGVAK